MKFFSIRYGFLEKALTENNINITSFIFGRKNRQSKKRVRLFLKNIADVRPDIFWVMKDAFITPIILRRIKKVSPRTKICMWWGDQRGNIIPPLISQRKGLIDALLITNNDTEQIKMYKKFGIKHVETFYHSFSIEEFKLWNIKPKYDVFFGGSCFKPHKFPLSRFRKEFINNVNDRFKLVVHGNGWSFSTREWLMRNKYAKALRTGKMNLGINHYDITRYYNRRLFESVGSGRLHITYYIPGMEKHFTNRKHLVWFTDINQGLKQINYFLKHPKEREAIAMEGRAFFIRNHSWPVRAKQLKHILEHVL